MKKHFLPFVLTALLVLTGCGSAAAPAETAAPPAASAAAAESPALPSPPPPSAVPSPAPSPVPSAPAEETAQAKSPDPDGVDVDLTQLSSTMVYSEVFAMVYEPEEYMGKTVKMNGEFSVFEGVGGQLYFTCIVKDATACCAQGLEFELDGDYVFPDDYPEPGSEITVLGTFDKYEEEHDGNRYYYLILRHAKLL